MRGSVALLVSGSLAAGLMDAPPAAADDLVKGIIGLGGAILLNEAIKNEQRRQGDANRRSGPSFDGRAAAAPVSEETRLARAEVQRRLNALGYDAGRPDGVFGPRTRRAIAQFQMSIGELGDGKISPAQIERLYAMTGGGFAPSAGRQGFPPVAGVDGQFGAGDSDAPAFPTLGGGAAPSGGGDSPAFPALGAGDGQAKGDPTAAFPTLGGAPAEKAGGSPAFPVLGAAPDEAAESMPELGAPPDQSAESFPPVAAAPTPEGDALFPSVAAPPATSGMPPIAGTGKAAAVDGAAPAEQAASPSLAGIDPAEMTLEMQLAKTPYKSASALPAILDLKLGMSSQFLADRLTKQGYSDCSAEGGITSCTRATDTLDDVIRVGADADGLIWLIDRSVSFRAPVETSFLAQQMQAAYPEITASPTRIVGSSKGCTEGLGLPNVDDASIANLATFDESDENYEAGLAVLADCPVGFMVDYGSEPRTRLLRLRFHDATGHIRRHIEAAASLRQEQQDAVKKDLKL